MDFRIEKNDLIARDVFKLELSGDASAFTAPGQFANVAVPLFYLRRPISVCDWADGHLTLVYKHVGEGTHALSKMKPGQALDILTGLGHGFSPARGKKPLLVGGGLGAAPLLALARRMEHPQIVLGFQSAQDVFLLSEFQAAGSVTVATVDGTMGVKGFVTDAMAGMTFDYVYVCGPEPMMKAVHAICPDGQYSFEARMACGFGACMGCSAKTRLGSKRICKDGPVLEGRDILWRI